MGAYVRYVQLPVHREAPTPRGHFADFAGTDMGRAVSPATNTWIAESM